eukprot:2667635-Prymnesium_polylepis.1
MDRQHGILRRAEDASVCGPFATDGAIELDAATVAGNAVERHWDVAAKRGRHRRAEKIGGLDVECRDLVEVVVHQRPRHALACLVELVFRFIEAPIEVEGVRHAHAKDCGKEAKRESLCAEALFHGEVKLPTAVAAIDLRLRSGGIVQHSRAFASDGVASVDLKIVVLVSLRCAERCQPVR